MKQNEKNSVFGNAFQQETDWLMKTPALLRSSFAKASEDK